MNTTALLNLTIECSGLVLCALGLLQVGIIRWLDRRTSRFFVLLFSGLILLTVSNIAGQLMRGLPGPGWRAGLLVSNFLEFFSSTWLVLVASGYLLSTVDPEGRLKKLRAATAVLFCAHTALLIVSQFTGLLYVIDAANVYHRSRWYPLCSIAASVMLLMDMGLLVRYRSRLSRKERTAFWIYFSVPLAAMILQLFVYGIYFVIFATILCAAVLYIFLLTEQAENYLRQEKALSDMRVNVLLSQIRPHFIYNILTSVYVLCRDDPPRAQEVIQDFTDYLRSNFTAIAATDPVSFSDELRHTKAYLAVEAIRYGDRLEVEYDTQHTAFRLPALTLEPLVENAVKHGMENSRSRVRIVIRTAAENGCAVLTVEDNGPGFDPAALENSGRVGLKNVRERLERMCGGTLEVRSSPGAGTTVTVRIPAPAPLDRLME